MRRLAPGDEAALEAFLSRHADQAMFLRANLRRAGLVDQGEPHQATYAALLAGDRITAVAAHCWNGLLLVLAPTGAERLAPAAAAWSGRPRVAGLLGPWAEVQAARRGLGLAAAPTALESHQDLFALPLDRLLLPAPLAEGRWTCRLATDADREPLVAWRMAFRVAEFGGDPADPELAPSSRADVERLTAEGGLWLVLDEAGRPAACCAYNARLPDRVQIGGVWTPPERRGRGFGRAVVAGALAAARDAGAGRAVLFADRGNAPAQRAYRALGFAPVGDYAITLFRRA